MVAVAAGAAGGADGLQESFAFVQAQGLHAHPGEVAGDGDAVHPGGPVADGRRRVGSGGCGGNGAHSLALSVSLML